MIVTGVLVATVSVVALNVVEVDPAGTVTDAGTVAAAVLLLESVTSTPPAGAAEVSVTVPVDVAPPTTAVGLIATAERAAAGFTVNVAVLLTPE